jgi:signal peptidase I
MKKKWLIRTGIAVTILFALYWLLRLTFILTPITIASGSSLPTLGPGKVVWISRLKKTARNSFVCFRYTDSMFGKSILVHRMVATEGDTVEINKGILYVNGKDADSGLAIQHWFRISKKNSNARAVKELIEQEKENEDNLPNFPVEADSFLICTTRQSLAPFTSGVQMVLKQPGEENEGIQNQWNRNWNQHFFGPVVVPKDFVFVMGDNRDNAMDSRYIGFVPRSSIVATVLGY